jgi:type IV secretory pathway VirB3-like protein
MLRTLIKDYSILIFVRVASRAIDFFLKIFVIRAIDPNIFATTVHFELITNVALFYTKTCLKNSYQKRAEGLTDREMAISASNLMLLGVPICLVVAAAMVGVEALFSSTHINYFIAAAALHAVAAVIESLQESFLAKLVLEMKYDRIGRNELISLMAKSSVLWVSIYMGWFHTYGVLVFGSSQLAYSLMLIVLTFFETKCSSYILRKVKCDGK